MIPPGLRPRGIGRRGMPPCEIGRREPKESRRHNAMLDPARDPRFIAVWGLYQKRPLHNTPSAASLSRFGLGHVRKHTPFALTLSSLHLWHSAKSLPKKRCFFGQRPFCKGLGIRISPDLVTSSTQTCNGISTDTYPLCHRRLIGW